MVANLIIILNSIFQSRKMHKDRNIGYNIRLLKHTFPIAAMIDRITFNSYVLDMNGESYRLAQIRKAWK